MVAVVLVYAGLITTLVGVLCALKPLALLTFTSRWHGLTTTGFGVAMALIGWNLPAKDLRIAAARTRLDEFLPLYQFSEFHSIRVAAPKERVYRAIKAVRADEVFLFRTLTWIRRFGRSGPEGILSAPADAPLLEVAMRSGFTRLAEESEQELVIGTLVLRPHNAENPSTPAAFKDINEPGFAIAAMNFRLEHAGASATVVTTEIRVYATDPVSRRRFARYWRTIYPGSALIRRMWLRAIRKRGEAAGDK
jgi:hypothetical protein